MRAILKSIPFICILSHLMALLAQCAASPKTGSAVNNNITTGEATLFTSSLALNASSYFTVTLPTAMSTSILQVGLGVIGNTFIIEREKGWAISVLIVNASEFTI